MARFSGYYRNATSAHATDLATADRPATPWIGLSTSVPFTEGMSVEEAMTAADLNYRVNTEPIFRTNRAGERKIVADKYLVLREDNEHVFNTCGKDFAPWQNSDFFAFAESLVDEGLQLDAVGSWDHGAKVFLSAKLPQDIMVNGIESEEHSLYLMMTNAHDCTGAGTISITPIRLRCANMLNLAFKEAKNRWTLRHTRTLQERLEVVRQSIDISSKYVEAFAHTAAQLIDTSLTLDEFDAFLAELVPAETSGGRENRTHAGIRDTYLTSGLLTPGNAWGALNAVSEYSEHLRGGRGTPETRFQSNMFGQTEALRNRAVRLLTHN